MTAPNTPSEIPGCIARRETDAVYAWFSTRRLQVVKGDTNARELAAHASTPAVPVRETAAADYLRNLLCASYLRETRRGHGTGRGGVQARFQLIANTGPRPPMVCRADAIYDPNLGKTVWVRPVTEEDAIYGQ